MTAERMHSKVKVYLTLAPKDYPLLLHLPTHVCCKLALATGGVQHLIMNRLDHGLKVGPVRWLPKY